MIKSLSILFWIRKNKLDKKSKASIYCRITVDGARAELALRKSVFQEKWESSKGLVKGSTRDAQSTNEYISKIKNDIYEAYRSLEESNSVITANAIKKMLLGNDANMKSQKNVFVVFEEHNSKVKQLVNKDFAYRTYEMYQTCLKHLREFVLKKYTTTNYPLSEINSEFISSFDHFLRAEKSIANNTTIKYIKNFKKIIRIAIANGWIQVDPFLSYRARLVKIDRGYLTQKELDIISNKPFSTKRVEQVKDMFLFQCYTGLAYCDARVLTCRNIVSDSENVLWIKTYRQKTHSSVNVPLLPKAMEILEKYKAYPKENKNGYLLPFLSNQKMNAYLKEISDICGIDKKLSSHHARHTFATTITLSNGVSLEAVSKMLSHASINTTKIYARMLDSRVANEMNVLKNKLTQ